MTGLVPDLFYAEVANALLGYVRHRRVSHANALDIVRSVRALPLEVVEARVLAEAALALAIATARSAYDACYLALAEAAKATLVTADRSLARHAVRVALLPDQGPPD